MAVRVVTDSTSDLPADLAQSLDITVVPLEVRFGTEQFKDGVDLHADEFYERLINGPVLPTTSQPSVGDFVDVYERLGRGADGIVSVHISSKLSGTFNSAVQARAQANVCCSIEVVDTLQVSMGVGMVAMVAASVAKQDADLEQVTKAASEAADRCECIALFDTLEYLEKGGRIGKVGALLGSLLRIKPMIIIRDGVVHELAKERSRRRGIARLQRVARDFAPMAELAVMYSTTPDEADALAEGLTELLPEGKSPIIVRFGPVLGTHAGPGVLGIQMLRASESPPTTG